MKAWAFGAKPGLARAGSLCGKLENPCSSGCLQKATRYCRWTFLTQHPKWETTQLVLFQPKVIPCSSDPPVQRSSHVHRTHQFWDLLLLLKIRPSSVPSAFYGICFCCCCFFSSWETIKAPASQKSEQRSRDPPLTKPQCSGLCGNKPLRPAFGIKKIRTCPQMGEIDRTSFLRSLRTCPHCW